MQREQLDRDRRPGLPIDSGEDLANVGPVALLQDLSVMALLGVTHVLHDRPLVASADDRRLVTWADEASPARTEAITRARASLDRAERALAVLDTASGHTRFDEELRAGRAAAEQARRPRGRRSTRGWSGDWAWDGI